MCIHYCISAIIYNGVVIDRYRHLCSPDGSAANANTTRWRRNSAFRSGGVTSNGWLDICGDLESGSHDPVPGIYQLNF